jgi:hypothetical protein
MCRSDQDTGGKRRCPCDTNEARRLRNHSKRNRIAYAPLAVTPALPRLLDELEADAAQPFTAEQLREDIAELNSLTRDGSSEFQTKADAALIRIGTGIEYLAQTKYGAPTDIQIRDAITQEEDSRIAEKEQWKTEFAEATRRKTELRAQLHATGITSVTHPDPDEMWTAWKEALPKVTAEAASANQAYDSLLEADMQPDGNETTEGQKHVSELYMKRNQAIKSALEEVGVKFADPASLNVHRESEPEAVASLKEAIAYYPQEWVDNSNNAAESYGHNALKVRYTKGRAHYLPLKRREGGVRFHNVILVQKPADWVPDMTDKSDSEYEPTDENGTWTDPLSGEVHQEKEVAPGFKTWARVEYEYSTKTTDLSDEAWKPTAIKDKKLNPVTKEYEFTGKKVRIYRRKKIGVTPSNKVERFSELVVSDEEQKSPTNANKGFQVAIHEFAHRVEHTTRGVKEYESAFLARRAGLNTDNPEKLTRINSKVDEFGYKDNFAEHYMGRTYEDGATELLSMGMESIFSGTQGGLVGAKNYKADADYKRFIFGMLASSAKTNS